MNALRRAAPFDHAIGVPQDLRLAQDRQMDAD